MKKLSIAVSTVFVIGFAVFNLTGPVSATPDREKVDICHATSSESNPFVSLNVAQDSVDGDAGNDSGQGDHFLNHEDDIIPPIAGIHSGLNWTTEGQAIWANGCEPVDPTTTTITTTTAPTTTTTSTTTTEPNDPTTTLAPTTTTTSTTVPATITTTTALPITTTTSVPGTTTTTTLPTTTTVVPTAVQPQREQQAAQPISFTG